MKLKLIFLIFILFSWAVATYYSVSVVTLSSTLLRDSKSGVYIELESYTPYYSFSAYQENAVLNYSPYGINHTLIIDNRIYRVKRVFK